MPLAPCHCDPLCENFLDTGEPMYIIDYEYAGNNDPMWDLGDLSVEGGFGAEQDAALLAAYFGGEPPADAGRPDGDPQGDVRPVVDAVGRDPARQRQPGRRLLGLRVGRFERCRALMSSPDFDGHVAAIGTADTAN